MSGTLRRLANGCQAANFKARVSGQVRVGDIPRTGEQVGYQPAGRLDFERVLLVKSKEKDWHELAPEHVGPVYFHVTDEMGQLQPCSATTMQHMWHGICVYDFHLDENGEILPSYYTERDKIFHRHNIHLHHPNVKYNVNTYKWNEPKFVLWNGDRIPLRTAKIHIFGCIYSHLVQQMSVYKQLVKHRKEGANVLLVYYDGFDFEEHGYDFDSFVDLEEGPWSIAHILYALLLNKSYLRLTLEDLCYGKSLKTM